MRGNLYIKYLAILFLSLIAIFAACGLFLTNAKQSFSLLLLLGSGTGSIYILRWFWWRINAYTEIIAMISSLIIAIYLNFINTSLLDWEKIVVGAILTTFIWVFVTFLTPVEDRKTLENFVKKVNPGGPGWKNFYISDSNQKWSLPNDLLLMFCGTLLVISILLGLGNILYFQYLTGIVLFIISVISTIIIFYLWK